MASKIKVDQIEGQSGTTVTLPSGQTLDLSSGSVTLPDSAVDLSTAKVTGTLGSSNLPTVPVTKGGTGLTSLGTAGQGIKVNSGGTALEFGQLGTIKQIVSGVYKVGNVASTSNHGNWINVDSTTTSITPTSTSAKILGLVTGIKGHSNGSNQGSLYTIFRDINGGGYSNLHADGGGLAESVFQESSGNNSATPISFNFIDEPNTTSQVNYKHFYKAYNTTGGTTYYYSHAGYGSSNDAYIRTILMEF